MTSPAAALASPPAHDPVDVHQVSHVPQDHAHPDDFRDLNPTPVARDKAIALSVLLPDLRVHDSMCDAIASSTPRKPFSETSDRTPDAHFFLHPSSLPCPPPSPAPSLSTRAVGPCGPSPARVWQAPGV
ncbi:hypothetical protein PAHAL_2G394500 [Panicum hallii]|uniref:Uncharacterized protein n=1 Tax=Panicum hallii TaxID=206008 RepID=A0A2T8KS55_9POAL|nr:hypothetical protein PAHAL_2G394500 [Panicum hallii]